LKAMDDLCSPDPAHSGNTVQPYRRLRHEG
jgi:hypothetical protein